MKNAYTKLKILPVKITSNILQEVNKLSVNMYLLSYKNGLCYLLKQFDNGSSRLNDVINQTITPKEEHYILNFENKNIGYFSIKTNIAKKVLFISKLHLDSTVKNQGVKIGKHIIDMLILKCKRSNISKLQLHANTKNNSSEIYKKWGFKILKHIYKYVNPEIRENYYLMGLNV